MPNAPLPQGMNPLQYGSMLLGNNNRGANDPFILKKNLEAQQAQAQDQAAQAQALLDEVKATIEQTSDSNKLKELALKLKGELDKSRALEEKLQADPEAAALFEQLTQAQGAAEAAPAPAPTQEMMQ